MPLRPIFTPDGLFDKPKIAAPRKKKLPPSAFASGWEERPGAPIEVGIRLVGEKIVDIAQDYARGEIRAARESLEPPLHDIEKSSLVDTYNTALMQAILVEALCDPDDVSEPFFKTTPHDTIGVALPPNTLLALWEEYEQLSVTSSPAAPCATAEELAELAERLEAGDASPRVLRLVRHLLDEMRATATAEE